MGCQGIEPHCSIHRQPVGCQRQAPAAHPKGSGRHRLPRMRFWLGRLLRLRGNASDQHINSHPDHAGAGIELLGGDGVQLGKLGLVQSHGNVKMLNRFHFPRLYAIALGSQIKMQTIEESL